MMKTWHFIGLMAGLALVGVLIARQTYVVKHGRDVWEPSPTPLPAADPAEE